MRSACFLADGAFLRNGWIRFLRKKRQRFVFAKASPR